MGRKYINPGTVILIKLEGGKFAYGLVRHYSQVSYFKLLTDTPISDLRFITESEVLFSVTTCDTAFKKWEKIGRVQLSCEMNKLVAYFMQNESNLDKCFISDEDGREYHARPEDCIGLERASVWKSEHIEERILDEIAGRKNKIAERFKVKITDN
ncbi:hypothetical protein HC752_13985 [Vibrio sp. S9_S30]|uniref:Imm26 family immunity protein n=1 Tax=Vibrio sp. S9_S30 TaxID=2720226 RepID=UPI001681B322|nr:Imm26 family immunity protein [Vibrio sp. S9_S30]MBD1558045.1 hypothetical protein [Vibrio sp. S9_S30]